MSPLVLMLVAVAVPAAFFVSASAGLGGSLIMVPTMMLILGTKEGAAMAALLLAMNNVAKVVTYRRVIPFKAAAGVVALTFVGVALGATLLLSAPDRVIEVAVVLAIVLTLIAELAQVPGRTAWAAPLALGAGLTSGFSGTSGPLKGVALRSLDLDRRHLVGAASLVSLVGDATKTAIFAEAGLLGRAEWLVIVALIPVMIAATALGSRFNDRVGETGYSVLFWSVMGGYLSRILLWG
ncbi:sulfite exporter TauE/SafE family protein [Ilumatobacter nonamiensis]|uniref:sulfite exporter TauE/SafE family protein n=1 Tax=Ilumatobacter nonamiensis TaxID=467093 RepID=UPI00058BEAB3|nr:sulfite exporter TauE/SafE family protein [Ilumatobacter nonamiensis]